MSKKEKTGMSHFETKMAYHTLEKPALIVKKSSALYIGIPKDSTHLERRVPLTPAGVANFVNRGHKVVIEREAGLEASFSDHDYSEAGAEITDDREKIYKAHILLKVTPPEPDDIPLLQHDQIIISPLQFPTLDEAVIKGMIKKKVTALAFEYIKDASGSFPIVRSMSEIAGSTSIMIASNYLSKQFNGKGILLGGITGVPSSKVVILGAGIVGEFAARAALGLGANVKLFDNNLYKLMRVQNHLGTRLFTSVFNPESLENELSSADLAIGAVHSSGGRTPMIVPEYMVAKMKPGSVIIDVSIDQGGCFETSELTTHDHPVFRKHDVIHYCVPNIPSRIPNSASTSINNILQPILTTISETGGVENYLREVLHARNGVYLFKGCLTNQHIGERFNLNYTNINLLITLGS